MKAVRLAIFLSNCVMILASCGTEPSPMAPPPTALKVSAAAVSSATSLSLQAVSDAIDSLSASGALSPKLISVLRRRFALAQSAFEAGQTRQGRALLSSLELQTRGFVRGGALTAAQAAPLTAAVDNAVAGGLSLVSVSTGELHACGLSVDGQAWCWGQNTFGQLGDGTLTNRDVAAPVVTNLRFASLVAGGQHTCGVTAAGAAYCWGRNDFGELGNGTLVGSTSPVLVGGNITWSGVDIAWPLSCGLATDGTAYCWGSNQFAALGANPVPELCLAFGPPGIPCSSNPVPVSGSSTFRSVSTGLLTSCGLDAAGNARCWGWGAFGQLGDGVSSGCDVQPFTRCAVVPVDVAAGSFASISAGGGFDCGLSTSGSALCWGFNEYGQLGDGTIADHRTPAAVAGGHTFRAVVASKGNNIMGHACGLTGDGLVFCWGSNAFGQLGTTASDACTVNTNLSPVCSKTPIAVDGAIIFATISPGNAFTCGVDVGRGTFCWGFNVVGEVGDGTLTNRAVPTRVVMQ
jgi:alpha-tubulin suppressor-like RCC1 family protein